MDEKFNAILSVAVVPATVALIVDKECMDDVSAIRAFYRSKTYASLADEETKVWHFSPLTLYWMWKGEMETGQVLFPEEC